MRPRELRLLLQDIRDGIQDIQEFTHSLDFEGYGRDKLVRRGVEREFIIIGEAVRRIHDVSEDVSRRIDEAIKIAGFRNFLVHEYEAVDEKKVWKIVTESLPRLKQQIDAWAAELGMDETPG